MYRCTGCVQEDSEKGEAILLEDFVRVVNLVLDSYRIVLVIRAVFEWLSCERCANASSYFRWCANMYSLSGTLVGGGVGQMIWCDT